MYVPTLPADVPWFDHTVQHQLSLFDVVVLNLGYAPHRGIRATPLEVVECPNEAAYSPGAARKTSERANSPLCFRCLRRLRTNPPLRRNTPRLLSCADPTPLLRTRSPPRLATYIALSRINSGQYQ